MTEFVGAARPIIAHDVALAANVYHIELAALRAVLAVESRNSGYDSKRRPIILFEPHIFYKELTGSQRDAAVKIGLAYPNWKGPGSYPAGLDAQYRRLAMAIKINAEAAYRSVSIGIGQVLGRNFRAAGCTSAKQMFEQAMESESNQLGHMLSFIKFNGLIDDLQRRDWRGFAAGYNGKGQVERYAGWLEREYQKWKKIVAKPRQDLTAEDLREAGSKTIAATDEAKKAVGIATVAGPAAGVALDAIKTGIEPVQKAVETAQQAQTIWQWISENWSFLLTIGLTVLFLIACWYAWKAVIAAQNERVDNARTGVNMRI